MMLVPVLDSSASLGPSLAPLGSPKPLRRNLLGRFGWRLRGAVEWQLSIPPHLQASHHPKTEKGLMVGKNRFVVKKLDFPMVFLTGSESTPNFRL